MGAPGWVPDDELRRVESVSVKDGTPTGGFRLILVDQAIGWERAVRVQHGEEGWTEVKCGDVSGKVARTNPGIKYSDMYVKYKGLPVKLSLWAPGSIGFWNPIKDIIIQPSDFQKYDGWSYYIYWANHDDESYFKNYQNQIKANNLI
ncbi:hypothetical protein ACTA71_008778 [Dictyostelium dimigraforme]